MTDDQDQTANVIVCWRVYYRFPCPISISKKKNERILLSTVFILAVAHFLGFTQPWNLLPDSGKPWPQGINSCGLWSKRDHTYPSVTCQRRTPWTTVILGNEWKGRINIIYGERMKGSDKYNIRIYVYNMYHWYSLIFIDLHWSSLIFIDLHWSSLIFIDLHWSSLIFIDLHWYSLIFIDIHWYSLIFIDLHWSSLIFIDIHWYSLIFIDIHWSSLIFIDLHWYSLIFIDLHWSSLIFIDIHWYSLIFIDIHMSISLYRFCGIPKIIKNS